MINSQNTSQPPSVSLLTQQQQQRSVYQPRAYQPESQPLQQVNMQSARKMSTNKKARQEASLDSLDLPNLSHQSAQPYYFKSGAVYTGSWVNQ